MRRMQTIVQKWRAFNKQVFLIQTHNLSNIFSDKFGMEFDVVEDSHYRINRIHYIE